MTLLLPLLVACASSPPDTFSVGAVSESVPAAVIEAVTLDLLGGARGLPVQAPEDVVHLYTGAMVGDRVLVGGAGGLFLLDVQDGVVEEVGALAPTDGPFPDARVVGALSADQALVSIRQQYSFRTAVVEVGPGGGLREVRTLREIASPTALARRGDDVLVLDAGGALWTWSADAAPLPLMGGLTSPRDLVVVGAVGIVADRADGLVSVDLRAGSVLQRVPTHAAPLDLERVGDLLYVAEGSFGVEVFDVSDPTRPARVAHLATPATAEALAASGDTLWVASMRGVAAVDIGEPAAPWVAGFRGGEDFSLGVVALEDGALALDWSYVHRVARVGDAAPVLDLSQQEVALHGAGEVRLTNLGTLPVRLGEVSIDGKGVEVGALPASLEPGETTGLRLDVASGAAGAVRFETSDPDQRQVSLPVHEGAGVALAVGQTAPPVRLQDLDGEMHDLDLASRPVLLAFFATWCPVCPPEVDDLQALADTLDAEIWLVAGEDDRDALEAFRTNRHVTLPILLDEGGRVHERFRQVSAFEQALYPQNWLVGVDGTVAYAANHYEPEAIQAVVANL